MKIFISWSGATSKNLAEILRQWLPAVIQAVKPYYSPDDITKGARWNTEISKELEESSIGIICLTSDNLEAPWIMFEAGALSKKMDKSKVCPILFGPDPSDIKGPLIQFQAAKFEKEEVKKVVRMINIELGEKGLASNVFDEVFEMWWPKLKEKVESELKSPKKTDKGKSRSEREILEEILDLTRTTVLATERSSRRRVSPEAFVDFAEGLRRLLIWINRGEPQKILYNYVAELRRPIRYLLRESDAPTPLIDEIEFLFDEIRMLRPKRLKTNTIEDDNEIIERSIEDGENTETK